MSNSVQSAALPYPVGINLSVFEDDGRWDDYSAWFNRSSADLRDLSVAKIVLRHWTETEEPAYSSEEWKAKAEQLLSDYPNCVFIYC